MLRPASTARACTRSKSSTLSWKLTPRPYGCSGGGAELAPQTLRFLDHQLDIIALEIGEPLVGPLSTKRKARRTIETIQMSPTAMDGASLRASSVAVSKSPSTVYVSRSGSSPRPAASEESRRSMRAFEARARRPPAHASMRAPR